MCIKWRHLIIQLYDSNTYMAAKFLSETINMCIS